MHVPDAPPHPRAGPHVATHAGSPHDPHSRSPGTARSLGPRVTSQRCPWGEWAPSQTRKQS